MRSIKAIVVGAFFVLGCAVITLSQSADRIDTGSGPGIEQGKQADGVSSRIIGSTYQFSALSGVALEDMSSGATELIGPGADNNNSALANIGFVSRFDGGYYTTFGVNANGLLRMGSVTTTAGNINGLDNAQLETPKIAPFWDDLCVGNTGKVHYKNVTNGSIRKLVVEWKNMKTSRGTGCDGSGGGTFQLWLFDRTGIIQFVYGNGIGPTAASDNGYSIGIQSHIAMLPNYASVTSATNSVTYGTQPNSTQMNAIAAGTSYAFTPNMPAAPSGGYATVTQDTATPNWTDNATNETGYLVRRTTNHVDFYFIGFLGANEVSFTDTGLSPSTQYFYYVNALSEGAFSDDLIISAVPGGSASSISSTAAGGNWSAPETWVGGVVPTGTDAVTIAPGATVILDAGAAVESLKVGAASGAPAKLKFEETAGRTLQVDHDVMIEAGCEISIGGGTVTSHGLRTGGNLINNGTLDMSANGGQAGVLLDFTGGGSVIFGGTGAITDIFRIRISKASVSSIVELAVSNFTVNGSATDGPGSAYLSLAGGVFKISGNFTGAHRTFISDTFDTGTNAGFWLNNPNYTVTPRPGLGTFNGPFRLSAGEFNVGNADTGFFARGPFTVEGGRLNAAGHFSAVGNPDWKISGGKITVCMQVVAQCAAYFYSPNVPGTFSGGEIVAQNSTRFDFKGGPANLSGQVGTTLRLGSAASGGPGNHILFTTSLDTAYYPNVVLDTSSGFTQTVTPFNNGNTVHMKSLTIPVGGTVNFSVLVLHGNVANDGEFRVLNGTDSPGFLEFDDLTGQSDITYSGTGIFQGTVKQLNIRCRNMTFDQAGGNLVSYNLKVTTAHLVNAGRLILGRHDSTQTLVEIYGGGSVDVSPLFDLGPNGQRVVYGDTNTTGPEINDSRYLKLLSFTGPGTLTLGGGDLSAERLFLTGGGVLKTGAATLSIQLDWAGATPPPSTSYVDGNLRLPLTAAHAGHTFILPVGQNGYSPVSVGVSSVSGPSAVTIRAVDMTLPGLDPTVSASRYWTITEEGSATARLTFWPLAADINGNQANYLSWRSNGGAPVPVTTSIIDQLTGDWGRGAALAPASVSVSGTVTNSTGQPIRNAIVTISGGGLPAPVTTSTGNFGTYSFENLPTGGIFTVQVSAKRYRFVPSSQMVTANNNVTNVNFAANPQE